MAIKISDDCYDAFGEMFKIADFNEPSEREIHPDDSTSFFIFARKDDVSRFEAEISKVIERVHWIGDG